MVKTFSTSRECYESAGIRNVTLTTFPNINMVDGFREEIYSKIVDIIGTGRTDVNNVGKTIEKEHVREALWKLNPEERRYRPSVRDLTQREIGRLIKAFNITYDGVEGIPGENT